VDKPSEFYLLPLGVIPDYKTERILQRHSTEILAKLQNKDTKQLMFNAIYDPNFRIELLRTVLKKKLLNGKFGKLELNISNRIKKYFSSETNHFQTYLNNADSKEVRLQFDEMLNLKLYRKPEEGVNPGEEVLRFISEKTSFRNVPVYAGSITYLHQDSQPIVVGIFQEYVSNHGSAWSYVLDSLERFYEYILSRRKKERREIIKYFLTQSLFLDFEASNNILFLEEIMERIFLGNISLLGKRTGELHLFLSSANEPAFKPEPFSSLYQRAIYQSIRTLIKSTFRTLRKKINDLDQNIKDEAESLLKLERSILDHLSRILTMKIPGKKIRIHGDYHLQQIYFTGKDFVIQNFEGPQNVTISERRLRRSALRDIASMIYSLYFASHFAIMKYESRSIEDMNELEPFASLWWQYMCSTFLKSYYKTVKDKDFIPQNFKDLQYLLETYLLEKTLNELSFSLNNKSTWVSIPIKGLKHLSKFVTQNIT